MTALPQSRLEMELALKSEIEQIREDDNWFHVGAVSINKKHPVFSVGYAHPIVADTHFFTQQFEVGQQRGWAIVLHSGGTPPDYVAGWLKPEEEPRAKLWVDKLNLEIQQRIAPLLAKQHEEARKHQAGGAEPGAEVLTWQQGHEYAPDSSWGGESVRLTRAGELQYERRHRGEVKMEVRGRIDPARFSTLVSTLAATKFPSPPQTMFPPGASVCLLKTEPPVRSMSIDFDEGQRLFGYGEIIGSLNALVTALRTSNEDELARWQFVRESNG